MFLVIDPSCALLNLFGVHKCRDLAMSDLDLYL